MRLTDRTRQIPTSPITAAFRWATERAAEADPARQALLDLSQAAPSYPTAPIIVERIAAAAAKPDGGRYSPTNGLPELRQTFAQIVADDYGAGLGSVSSDRVMITGGCNQAFCLAASALAQPGDEIIMVVPYYFNHDMWLRLDGIVPRYLHPGPDLIPSPTQAEALIGERTRAITLVSPGNPSGATIPPATISAFFELAQRHDIALILDETYRNFRYTDRAGAMVDDSPAHDLFSRPDWDQTLISLHSFSKDLAIPGYRVGALISGVEAIEEMMKLIDCMQISAPRVGQEAVTWGLTQANDWRRAQVERIGRSLARFREVMAHRPGGFELITSGAFFGWVGHPFESMPTDEVVRRLIFDHDVLAIPGTAFTPTDEGRLRFSYANLEPAQLDALAERLEAMAATIET